MKYIVLTFDDGRDDNYIYAFPILKNYSFPATIYCTTGFIDGTWKKKDDWYSTDKPISIEQLHELKNNGWEIGLHGDKHITDLSDSNIAIKKITNWGLFEDYIGYSFPDSILDEEKLSDFKKYLFPQKIAYLRRGRKINTSKFSSKILFGLYTFCGSQKAYNLFNKNNIQSLNDVDFENVYSVVIRFKDEPKMISNFIASSPDNSLIVLMFHSILPRNHLLFGKDPWNWEDKKFKYFADCLKKMKDSGIVDVITMRTVIQNYTKLR